MPRDASGNYSLPAGNPVVSGTTITATWANTTMPDIGDALTDSLSRSGQGGMLVPIRAVDGTVNEPAFSFSSEVTLGIYRAAAADMRFAAAGDQARVINTNQLEVLRDYGGGLTWYPVADSISEAVAGGDAFDAKLAGYADTGLHEAYTGDLNDIAVNSTYTIVANTVTNEPADFTSSNRAVLTTFMRTSASGQQILYGEFNLADAHKQWMRNLTGGVWEAWKLVVDGGAMTLRLAGYADTGNHAAFVGDVNTVLDNSVYTINTASTNIPSDMGSNGFLVTELFTAKNFSTQLIYGMNGNDIYKIWMRQQQSGIYDAWKLVVDGGAFTQRLAGYADTGLHTEYTGDLNVITANSQYYIVEVNVTNAPTDFTANGFLLSMQASFPDAATQVLFGRHTTIGYKQWMRQSTGGVWDAWKLVVDGGAFPQRLAGYGDDGLLVRYTGDLNDILVNSAYTTVANLNQPADIDDNSFGLTVTSYYDAGTSNGCQVIYGMTFNNAWKQWMRSKTSNVWGAWKLVVDGGAFTERLAGYADTGLLNDSPEADLNAILRNSVYNTTNVTLNAPADMNLANISIVATNMTNATNGVQQIYGRGADNRYKIWNRPYNGGAWEAWKLVVDGGAFTQRLAGYGDTGRHSAYTGDLDAILVNSTYRILGSEVTNDPPDLGVNDYAAITTFQIFSSSSLQIIYGITGASADKIWMRKTEAGPWTAWKLVVDGYAPAHDEISVLSGNTSVIVTHGMGRTPTNVQITALNAQNATFSLSVSAIGATTFTINYGATASANRLIAWAAW